LPKFRLTIKYSTNTYFSLHANPEKDRGLKLDSHGNIMVNIYQTVSLVLRSAYLLFLELLKYIANTMTEIKQGVGIKRAERLYDAATASIGLTEGLVAARLELAVLLEQYELYSKQEEQIMAEAMQILEHIPGTQEKLSIPGMAF